MRLVNTNIDGCLKVATAISAIKGVGRRFAIVVLKKANVDPSKRAGECTTEELDRILIVIGAPCQYKIADWFLNRKNDVRTGQCMQAVSSALDTKLRDDLERLKKIRTNRGMRLYWGLRARGQRTKTTGRHGRTVGVVAKKK